MKCESCMQELEPVFKNADDAGYQFDNALWIAFGGGYGMFVESPEYAFENRQERTTHYFPDATSETVICHDCAHKLCEENPWLNKLLKPESGHSHKIDFWESNPDHDGWDNPKNQNNQ